MALAAATCLLAGAGVGAARSGGPGSCSFWVSPSGNDQGGGSRGQPFATVAKLLSALRPGQTGCFAPGAVIQEHVVVNKSGTEAKPITLESEPNAQGAQLAGGVEFLASSHDVVFRHVAFRAPAVPTSPVAIVTLRGTRNEILDSDLDGGQTPDRSQACILLDHAASVLIDHDAIRECSRSVADSQIYAVGILDSVSSHATITNNLIVNQYSDAIALSPHANYTTVSRNTLQYDGSGLFLGGDTRGVSQHNLVVHNVFGLLSQYGVHSAYPPGAPHAKGNLVADNCFWKVAHGNIWLQQPKNSGFVASHNIEAPYASAKCAAARPARAGVRGAGPAPKPATKRTTAERPLSFGLGLLAGGQQTGNRVLIGQAYVTGVRAGASVAIRCIRGCSLSETLRATGSRVASKRLAHATLSLGDEVEVRATASKYVGLIATFEVKPSLSSGVFRRVSSGCLVGGRRTVCPK